VVLGFSVFMNFALLMVVIAPSMTQEAGTLIERRVSGTSFDKIAVISVRGVISRGQAVLLFPSPDMVASVRSQLRMARKDSAVKAVILEVDSPGGTILASDLILKDLQDFKKETKKPLVVCMQGMAASGGYYIAMAGDHIVAHPTTLTGSIGVIMQLINYKEFTKKHGLKWETFIPARAQLKDIGSPSRDMTARDREVFQNMVEKMYDLFVDRVVEGRKGKLTREEIIVLANGQPYLGSEAKESGLVDSLGTLDTAVEEASRLGGISKNPSVVRYEPPPSFASLFGISSTSTGSPDVAQALKALEGKLSPQLLFLYSP
jgi:protease-4